MIHFLIVYDRETGTLIGEPREFDHAMQALRTRFKIERTQNTGYEVVVLSGESEAVIRSTHARYFKTAAELTECLVGVADVGCT